MTKQVSHLVQIMNMDLRRLSKIRHLLANDIASLLMNSLVLSKLDYCNALLPNINTDLLNKLQKVQNNAARWILQKPRSFSSHDLLVLLHWLPVKTRIFYKICTIVFKCLNDQGTSYLDELINVYTPKRNLRSADDGKILVQHNVPRKIGERSFYFSAPHFWNSLPHGLRSSSTLDRFKSNLKTFLFSDLIQVDN